MAFLAFIMYDIVLRFVPTYVNFALLWLACAVDIVTCLHPEWHTNNSITEALVDAVSYDYPTVPH
ncbi:unnamed protein product, partial [Rotaria sordida]